MYETFYKLKRKPFQLNPDPDFFFDSAVHKRALAYLQYGLAQGEGFIVITGIPGTGKTMLVKELLRKLKNENIVAGLIVTTRVDPDNSLRLIAGAFNLPQDGNKAALLGKLEGFFKAKSREGKRALLIVDEAQNFPNDSLEELRMLSNIELDGKPLFQSFLLGQEEFRLHIQTQNMEQVRQRVIATFHLQPFDLRDTKKYILHRLTRSGWTNDPQLDDGIFNEIHDYTNGIPRKINLLFDRLLLYGFLEETHTLDVSAVKTVLKEMDDDMPFQPSSVVRPPENRPQPGSSAVSVGRTMHNNIESRVQYLEDAVEQLKRTLTKERALLRKVFLAELDSDETYDEIRNNKRL